MISLNWWRDIHIHPIMWGMIGIGILTGSFPQLLAIFVIIFAHEVGHYAAAVFFKWRVRTVMLWPFGGVMETDEYHTRPLKEELAVIVAGPLQHFWLYGLIFLVGKWELVSSGMIEMLLLYNTWILVFNLLPIWPLDGGKILFLLLSYQLPFVQAQRYVLYVSVMMIVISTMLGLLFLPFSLSTIFLACFLLWENRLEWKQRQYTFLRYLLKRYEEKKSPVRDIKSIHVPSDMPIGHIFKSFRRGAHHHIFVIVPNQTRVVIDEGECLYYYFTLKQSSAKAKDLAEWCAV
ncbi:site-2 protease family protein [Pontibacillus salicampi]|uniref:Site-2 protease family protein n=1 Tax=Pontibacillus salicampi TaxID=1449801 RepID=A0ABV6LJ90_9BACI